MTDVESLIEKNRLLKKKNNELVRRANEKVAEMNSEIDELKAEIERIHSENLSLRSELNRIKFSAQQEEKEVSEPRITLKSQSEINYNDFIH